MRSAKEMTVKLESSEGHEYIVPSLIASQIYRLSQPLRLAAATVVLTVRPALLSTAALSRSRYSSMVLKFLIIPSARKYPAGTLEIGGQIQGFTMLQRNEDSHTHRWSAHCHALGFDMKTPAHLRGGPRTGLRPCEPSRRACHD